MSFPNILLLLVYKTKLLKTQENIDKRRPCPGEQKEIPPAAMTQKLC